MVAGCEATGFDNFPGFVEVFRGVDVHEAYASWIGFLDIFFSEYRNRWVFGSDCFFDDSPW